MLCITMLLTYKYRLFPTKKQIQALDRTLETCRILYNSCVADRRNHYQTTGKGLSRIRQQEILKTDKKRISVLKDIHAQVLQNVLFRVDRSFQSFFRRAKDGRAAKPVIRASKERANTTLAVTARARLSAYPARTPALQDWNHQDHTSPEYCRDCEDLHNQT
jgi:transposase